MSQTLRLHEINLSTSGLKLVIGSGDPNNVVAGPIGSLFLRTDGSTSTTLYVKTSGTATSTTTWTAK